jgi:hypothetical protein
MHCSDHSLLLGALPCVQRIMAAQEDGLRKGLPYSAARGHDSKAMTQAAPICFQKLDFLDNSAIES